MKNVIILCLLGLLSFNTQGQTTQDTEKVTQACMNYIQGFYTGDSTLLSQSLRPRLNKLGYWQNDDKSFGFQGYMAYDEALAYAAKVKESGKFASPDAPKKVEVLDIGHTIAVTKITAWWGIDYLTLSREGDDWMIEQALWEGPLNRK